MADHSNNALQGFTIYQPTLGAALQFFPALGSAELDTMIQAFLPGPASIKDKRATICMDFYEYAGRTGETMKFYSVFPAVYTPVTTNSPVGSDYASAFSASPVVNDVNLWSFTTPSTPSSVAAVTPSSSQAAQSDRKASLVSRSRQDFSHMPGMKILTKDGVDVTNSATRGSKTKEQRDHAHLMRIIKACDACKKRKTRCDPSHKKRSVSQTSQASSPAATKPTKKTKVAAAPPPQISTNNSFMMPDMAMNDFSSFDLGLDAFSGLDGLEALNDFTYDPTWDQQFVNYDQELAVSGNYDFLFRLDIESSPSASSGSFYSSTTSSSASSSSHSSPSQQLIPSFEPVPNTLVTGRPEICSREVTEGLSGYSPAANGQDRYSQGSRARLRAIGTQEDAFAPHAVLNTNLSNRDAPPGQDGQDLAAGFGDSSNSQDSSSRSRMSATSLSRLSSPPSPPSRTASQAQGALVRPKTHTGVLDNQQHGQGHLGSPLLDSSTSKALRRAGPSPVPQSSVPCGQGPLLQVQNNTDRPPKLPAANAAGVNSGSALASYRPLSGLQQRIVSATEAVLSCSRVADVMLNVIPQSLQTHFSLPASLSRPEEMRPAALGTGLGLLVAALVLCATLSFWQHCAFSMQSALFVTPFAAKLWSRKGSEKWQPSTTQKQASVEDQRHDGLWQHAARLSLHV